MLRRSWQSHSPCRLILILLAGGELVLPLQLQFQLDLVQFPLQPLVFLEHPISASPLGINRRMQYSMSQLLLIRQQHQRHQCRPSTVSSRHDSRWLISNIVIFGSGS